MIVFLCRTDSPLAEIIYWPNWSLKLSFEIFSTWHKSTISDKPNKMRGTICVIWLYLKKCICNDRLFIGIKLVSRPTLFTKQKMLLQIAYSSETHLSNVLSSVLIWTTSHVISIGRHASRLSWTLLINCKRWETWVLYVGSLRYSLLCFVYFVCFWR